jgi:Ca2+/Na+ antiporter
VVRGTSVVQVAVIIATVLGLWLGARLLVDSAVRPARRPGLSELAIGLTVVAMGTSTPQLVVTTRGALSGAGDIAVGNVVGSNIYNLAFIVSAVSLLRVIHVELLLVHGDGLVLVGSTLVGFAAMGDLTVGNVVDSNVFNLFGILGIGAVIRPLAVSGAALESTAWLTVLVVVMVVALWSGQRLSRAEGGLFALSEIVRWVPGLLGIPG